MKTLELQIRKPVKYEETITSFELPICRKSDDGLEFIHIDKDLLVTELVLPETMYDTLSIEHGELWEIVHNDHLDAKMRIEAYTKSCSEEEFKEALHFIVKKLTEEKL
ncbi:hypothetical protein VP193E371_P0046 [Vibrio phage 193E37-1]|nr:hypothetical protein VP193E371_P0046 [Vibrio phage 193E37-1]